MLFGIENGPAPEEMSSNYQEKDTEEKNNTEKKSVLSQEIMNRADMASGKVKQKVQEEFIPNIEEYGKYAERWLTGLQNDFHHLAEDPNDESGGGNYEGWTSDEIKELYKTLYGHSMED